MTEHRDTLTSKLHDGKDFIVKASFGSPMSNTLPGRDKIGAPGDEYDIWVAPIFGNYE